MTDYIKPQFPVDSYLPQVQQALNQCGSVIVKAEPGAGKTTRIPPALIDQIQGLILVLEPRRLAARLSAERIAQELGEEVGHRVGYQIRFESRVSSFTKIKFITEGLFTRMIQGDPELSAVGCVIVDEFHERHIHTDVALAIIKTLQSTKRPDLKLVVMSATMDSRALERWLPDAQRFDLEGRTYPVEVEYLMSDGQGKGPLLEVQVQNAVEKMIADPRCPGDILVFLPGRGEISRAVQAVRQIRKCELDVLPLMADLPPAEQGKVFQPSSKRKVILSTNIAETSLTLPGITGVIDSGLARVASHASWSGLTTLDLKRISQASCIQRMGRAGRTQAGLCYRLFSERDYLNRSPFLAPEISRSDLSQTMLEVYAFIGRLGIEPSSFSVVLPWLEKPGEQVVAACEKLLQRLGAMDENYHITERGRLLADLPLHPRLGAIVLRGQDLDQEAQAVLAVAMINEGMLLKNRHQSVDKGPCDVSYQMETFLILEQGGELETESLHRLVDSRKRQRVKKLFGMLSRSLKLTKKCSLPLPEMAPLLMAGYSDRVALARSGLQKKKAGKGKKSGKLKQSKVKGPPAFNLCMGRGGLLDESSIVMDHELILAIDAAESQDRKSAAVGTQIRVASAINLDMLPPNDLKQTETHLIFSEKDEQVVMMERVSYGQLNLGESLVTPEAGHPVDQARVEDILRERMIDHWPEPFPDGVAMEQYHQRLYFIKTKCNRDDFPEFEGEMLELLIATMTENQVGYSAIRERGLGQWIRDQLSYEQITFLDDHAPIHYVLPSGRATKVHYEADKPPWIQARIQEFFGLRQTPKIGEIPLVLHLLAPNMRAVQVTQDLPGFWQNSWERTKSELGRRYPRHNWPDDPQTSEPRQHKPRSQLKK